MSERRQGEANATKERFDVTHSFPRNSSFRNYSGPQGEVPGVGQEAEKSKRKAQVTDFIGISIGKERQVRVNSLGLDHFNNPGSLGA